MIITLTGPSASGKTTAIKHFMKDRRALWKPVQIAKYVTRERRSDDGAEVIHVPKIPEECDLVYEQYGTRYGLASTILIKELQRGNDCLVVINDVRVVGDLKTMFGGLVHSIFLFKDSPRLEAFNSITKSRGVNDSGEALRRFQKAQAIFRIYIENITLFDHVVLNVGSHSLLRRQMRTLVATICGIKASNNKLLA